MFKIESYVTPILLSYVDKYVRDFKPANAQVSLWGGGVALHNLVLKPDVLQQEVSLPFTLVSGRIHELLIQVPWTKIMSEPIVVTIDTIECVLNLKPPEPSDEGPPPESPSRKSQVVEAPPGYMQALVRRIVSNISLRVHHLIVKYVQDDIVLSLNVKHMSIDSTGALWEPAFADIDASVPVIRRLVKLDDLTLCLDKADSDGKIRYYQEPLLYRCQLDLRVLTRLVSASTRRAASLSVSLRSEKLAWGVTCEQLALLLRLARERPPHAPPPPPPPANLANTQAQPNLETVARSSSWSEWAWSWLPAWSDKPGDAEDVHVPPAPLPLYFSAYIDDLTLVFKVMEVVEGQSRRRPRSILEASARFAAVRSSARAPSSLALSAGARHLALLSRGKCVCGAPTYDAENDNATIYLKRTYGAGEGEMGACAGAGGGAGAEAGAELAWSWPAQTLADPAVPSLSVEAAQAVDETYRASPLNEPEGVPTEAGGAGGAEPARSWSAAEEGRAAEDELWASMAPLLLLHFAHERAPPDPATNPYDNPPRDFEYSDWVEDCHMRVKVEPLELRVCMGLVHRLMALHAVLHQVEVTPPPERPMRVLTVEECESLSENIPERRVTVECGGLTLRACPWRHGAAGEPPAAAELALALHLPQLVLHVTGPLYPHRVCSAACQLPADGGALWQAARVHVSAGVRGARLALAARPCATADLHLVTHLLLHKHFFSNRESVHTSFSLKICEMSVSGSAARLQAAYHVVKSLLSDQLSFALKYTSLPTDALNDEEAVAIDLSMEELTLRGYLTRNIKTLIVSLHSARATALHEPVPGVVKQAWLFSAPDAPTTTPYLRMAGQWCDKEANIGVDFLGLWTEPIAISVDPLFIAWLAYQPYIKTVDLSTVSGRGSVQFGGSRRTSSYTSGRSSRAWAGAELVHMPPRPSAPSTSEPSEKLSAHNIPRSASGRWRAGDELVGTYQRLRDMLLHVELGLALLYVTRTSVSALDCQALCDAMERHAMDGEHVLVLSLGRFTMQSNVANQALWDELRHDGPTILKKKMEAESFPWKVQLAEMSCYTLEARRRRLGFAPPRTVLEPVTTSVTLSVVTRNVQIKNIQLLPDKSQDAPTSHIFAPTKTAFFTSGLDFKPTTLKEFFRGPMRRSRKESKKLEAETLPRASGTPMVAYEKVTITDGPVLSLGAHVHADTPPLLVKLDRDQINLVATAIHCFNHIVTLLKRPALDDQKLASSASKTQLPRSASENEPNQSETGSKSSELIEIFDRSQDGTTSKSVTTFFWCQWVVSHATLAVASGGVRLAFSVDDVITSVDLQPLYHQLKVKLASASIKHYVLLSNNEWKPGVMGGRVLEARETTTGAKDEDHFLAVTITLAHISDLPDSWKQELHPKLLEKTNGDDSMWEIYATLAPLEAIVQPVILDNVASLVAEMMPSDICPLHAEPHTNTASSSWLWPFVYVTAGGVRLLATGADDDDANPALDDTLIFSIEKISINPHPDNPICRRLVNTGESSWLTGTSNYEGRQYELTFKQIQLVTGKFQQLLIEELEDRQKHTHANPALKWTRQPKEPDVTPLLYRVDVCVIVAPAMYTKELLTCGPAVEVNLTTDCVLDLAIEQLALLQAVARALANPSTRKDDEDADEKSMDIDSCPYASVLSLSAMSTEQLNVDNTVIQEAETTRSTTGDSGVETVTSLSTSRGKARYFTPPEGPVKKTVSISVVDPTPRARDYLEVFVTMGTLELSLFVTPAAAPDLAGLDLAADTFPPAAPAYAPNTDTVKTEVSRALTVNNSTTDESSTAASIHLAKEINKDSSRKQDNIPLLHANLQQPNVYYWGRKDQRNLQISLFNLWVGRGTGLVGQSGNMVLLSTAKGTPDPVTDIPPALATLKIVLPTSSGQYPCSSARGSVQLDVERPVQLEVSTDRINLLANIHALMKANSIIRPTSPDPMDQHNSSFLHDLRQKFMVWSIESVTVSTSQVVVAGSEGAASWGALSAQVAAGARPPRLVARALLTALAVAAGPANDTKHVVLHPMHIGAELEATWEAWRRAEGGAAARACGVRAGLELDRAALDLRPADLDAAHRLVRAAQHLRTLLKSEHRRYKRDSLELQRSMEGGWRHDSQHAPDTDTNDHYYKDDLRSGAFKMSVGGQLPMAYQVLLYGGCVSWRYPHPRAITRIVAFPLPGLDKEVDCVLELFAPILEAWEPHTYFKIPLGGPSEINLQAQPPEALFATTWRFRCCSHKQPKPHVYEFYAEKFMPRTNPLGVEAGPSPQEECGGARRGAARVSAEQLAGALRVDSYFAPRALPRTALLVRCAQFEVHLHNSMPPFTSQSTTMEGYYVSRPLMRSHRVLSAALRSCKLQAHLDSPAGLLLLADTKLSADIIECSTGTMEALVGEARAMGGASSRTRRGHEPRARLLASPLHLALTLARLRTLQVLATDWANAIHSSSSMEEAAGASRGAGGIGGTAAVAAAEAAAEAARALEGRVSLWVHNSCVSALRVGQDGTDELVPLGPGVRLAYRWRSPTAPKRLHFALANPSASWQWSASLPFTAGSARVKLEEPADKECAARGSGVQLYVKVEETGAKRYMHLCGLLYLANMLRYKLLYKIRARNREQGQWGTVCSGEMEPETVGWSVLCAADAEIVLKIKFANHEAGWSGDIPLKECPKENVPWLVKVPSDGEVTYVSAWCRVSRGRSDGQVVAAVWPLYVLRSHLPLDTDVLVVTESPVVKPSGPEEALPAPLVQSTPGRGTYTHLLAPGTTANKHNLSFQYRNIQCPVTREAVPLHYGVTDTSVFDKRAPVMNVDEVLQEIVAWRKRSSHKAVSSWPYSVVTKHWHEGWRAALLQPRCDVSVRYSAVRAGGGCSLQVSLCPVALLCNAAPLALTLRAHDAGPLCVLQPGSALLPPSNILTKPFFMSVEVGRETFVSEQLQVSSAEVGRYGSPPRGHLVLGHATRFSVLCNQKVALLTLHYEIKEDINVIGVTPTYVLINRLDTDLQVSAIATPMDNEDNYNMRPKTFKIVKPTKEGSMQGTPLCRFMVRGRWRGGDEAELHKFVHLALPAGGTPAPVCLDQPPVRRALGLIGDRKVSIPVTVSQLSHEGRCLVVVAPDTCPQFLIQNLTKVAFCVGQPVHQTNEQPSTSKVLLRDECYGTRWWCVVSPDTAVHYSTPQYCERYPPPPPPAPPVLMPPVPMLAFGRILDDSIRVYQEWSAPVALADGEQLLPFHDGVTVKLRVTTHPHTTHLVLKDTDHHDISASDIRRRLNSLVSESRSTAAIGQSEIALERNWAASQLFPRGTLEYDVAAIGEPMKKRRASITLRSSPEPSALDTMCAQRTAAGAEPPGQPPAVATEPRDKPPAAINKPPATPLALSIEPPDIPPTDFSEVSDKPPPLGTKPPDKPPAVVTEPSIKPPAVVTEPSIKPPAAVTEPSNKAPAAVAEPPHKSQTVTIKLPGDNKPKRAPDVKQPPMGRDSSSQYPETSVKCTSCRSDSSKTTPSRATMESLHSRKEQIEHLDLTTSQTESQSLKYPHITGCRDPKCPNIIQVDKSHSEPRGSKSSSHDFKCPPCSEENMSESGSQKLIYLHSKGETKSVTGSQDTTCLLSTQENKSQTESGDSTVLNTGIIEPVSIRERVADARPDPDWHTRSAKSRSEDVRHKSDVSPLNAEASDVNLIDPNLASHSRPADPDWHTRSAKSRSEDVRHKSDVSPLNAEASDVNLTDPSLAFHSRPAEEEARSGSTWRRSEYVRCVVAGVVVSVAVTADSPPLFALHLDRTALLFAADNKRLKTIVSVADAQVDNLQYESGQYDFAVVASTRAAPLPPDAWPPLCSLLAERAAFATRHDAARLLLKISHDTWGVLDTSYTEITEVEIRVGSLALFVEDAYVKALVELSRLALSATGGAGAGGGEGALLADERAVQRPLRLRLLHIHPLNLTLTLHTAVRMYIALDQSPLRLSAFQLHDMMTSSERLTHALTVHYLSAAILGAGWVVGGLELLGAPGALAARVGEARGGVRGVAAAAAAALLRSLSACAGSLARNLDLLAGDDEHARRAQAARRRAPPSLAAGLYTGITNFAINILGAVGGLAHHPLVGVAVGESGGGALALRRGLVGALAKPLSATADLVAYAGHGLLTQTGWDPALQPRAMWNCCEEVRQTAGWRRDCVRWSFRLAELHTLAGFEVMFDNALHLLLLTHKYLVFADPETDRIIEMLDLKFCQLTPFQGPIIVLNVLQTRKTPRFENRVADEDDEYQISPTAMARVARYTGAAGGAAGAGEERALALVAGPGHARALYAALAALLHENNDTHFSIL